MADCTSQECNGAKNLRPQVELRAMAASTLGGGRYRLEAPLGHGGMATVYLARDEELARSVAVKLLAENLAGDAAFRERFLREARLAARLSHPNVVSVYDAGETDDGRPFIVMELVPGTTLAEVGRLPPDEAVGLVVQAAHGLAHAHAAGLVHRDIKPQNLLLRDDGVLKVADFGIARAAETTALTQIGTVLGTAAYLSPEQALGEEVTAAADVYALGAVLYELLTGRPPYTFESLADLAEQQRSGTIAPLSELAPGVPAQVEDAVMRALARNPAYRPATADAFADELTASAPPAAPARPDHTRLWWAIAAVVTVAAIASGIAAALTGNGSKAPPPPPRHATVQPIPRGADAQQQARNIAAWLRARSARP
jgi:eukaryotic-like serine/threonine-protein kinase